MNDLKHTVEDAVSLPSPHVGGNAEVVEPSASVGIETLEYYRRLHGRHTLYARVALLVVIVGMLGANMWLTQRNYHALLVNVDQARLAQAELLDSHIATSEAQLERIDVLETRLATLQAELEAEPEAELVAMAH